MQGAAGLAENNHFSQNFVRRIWEFEYLGQNIGIFTLVL